MSGSAGRGRTTVEDVRAYVEGLGGVLTLAPGPGDGTPELAWGDLFFYEAPDGVVPPGQPIPAHLLPPPEHPKAMTAMILGGVGLFAGVSFAGLGFVLSPFAWAIGSGALKEIEASQGRMGGASTARAGKIMGIVGTALLALVVLAIAAFVVSVVPVTAGSSSP